MIANVAMTQEQNLKKQQFCPRASEENPRCISKSEQYKCGAFFLNLPGRDNLTWISALPDVFRKVNLRKNPEIKETLGGATPRSFNISPDDCTEEHKLANARCFATMLKLRSEPFNSCAKNVINEGGEDTVGNVMCNMITEFYSEDDIPVWQQMVAALNRGIKIGFYHSECGSDWVPTGNPQGPLRAPKRLCCIKDPESGKFLQVSCRGDRIPILKC